MTSGGDTTAVAKNSEMPLGLYGLVAAIITGGVVFYFLVPAAGASNEYVNRANAVAPFVGLVSAVTLLAAIEALRTQRKELGLQREELALTRQVLKEQTNEMKRSAEAQVQLTTAQNRLASEQQSANTIAREALNRAEEANRFAEAGLRQGRRTTAVYGLLAAASVMQSKLVLHNTDMNNLRRQLVPLESELNKILAELEIDIVPPPRG